MKRITYIAVAIIVLLPIILASLIIIDMLKVPEKLSAQVSFETTGSVMMRYGVNENGNWKLFSTSATAQGYHKDVGTEYMRVWVSSQWYRPSTIPLHSDGTWNYDNLDSFVSACLATGATPFVVFAHAPGTYGEAHGEKPPKSDDEFASYARNVVAHFDEMCKNNRYSAPCDVNTWYFEVWNEPFGDEWWAEPNPRYPHLFNKVMPRIKEIAPGSKVGGFGTWYLPDEKNARLKAFLRDSDPDYVTIHHYGNIRNKYARDAGKMADVKLVAGEYVTALRDYLDSTGNMDVEIIEGEYSSDYTASYMPHLDEQFTAAWYASALIWHIKTQAVPIEMFYSGTSLHKDKGFAMWSSELKTWPVYNMKKQFTSVNTYGANILSTTYDEHIIDALLISKPEGMFLTVVNKLDRETIATINTKGYSLTDIETGFVYEPNLDEAVIRLEPYEIKFYSLNR